MIETIMITILAPIKRPREHRRWTARALLALAIQVRAGNNKSAVRNTHTQTSRGHNCALLPTMLLLPALRIAHTHTYTQNSFALARNDVRAH